MTIHTARASDAQQPPQPPQPPPRIRRENSHASHHSHHSRHSQHSQSSQPASNSLESSITATLWEEVPFPKLPVDAPKELLDYIVHLENPKQVYGVHRATRRHNFQALVGKFIVQLRHGCNSPACCTATCFTMRKRCAGKAPIRRYNSTSARALACYLASQDNPETSLCPYVTVPLPEPLAFLADDTLPVANLSHAKTGETLADSRARIPLQTLATGDTTPSRPKVKIELQTPAANRGSGTSSSGSGFRRRSSLDQGMSRAAENADENVCAEALRPMPSPFASTKERRARKDHRSFSANLFGTFAFRMLDWLSPAGILTMTDWVNANRQPLPAGKHVTSLKAKQESGQAPHTPSPARVELCDEQTPTRHTRTNHGDSGPRKGKQDTARLESSGYDNTSAQSRDESPTHSKSAPCRQQSTPATRRHVTSKSAKLITPDHAATGAEDVPSVLKLPRSGLVSQAESQPKPFISPSPIRNRLNTGDVGLRNVSPEPFKLPAQLLTAPAKGPTKQLGRGAGENGEDPKPSDEPLGLRKRGSADPGVEVDSDAAAEFLPESLSRLNLEIIDLLCDILQEDGTSERHFLYPDFAKRKRRCSTSTSVVLSRSRTGSSRRKYPAMRKQQWKLFIEQSLFSVLSNAISVIASFTTADGELLDSPTLWYCMLRITRVAPSLVFDSLWIAAASLFSPPKRLQSLHAHTSRFLPISLQRSLSSKDAGNLLAICLHALVAAAPLLCRTSAMFKVSRMRAQGLVVSNKCTLEHDSLEIYLNYEECFSDALIQRLARRLFAAISAQRGFKELIETDLHADADGNVSEADVLDALLSQLELLTEHHTGSSPVDFSLDEREIHQKRVPTLLLDWARAIMLRDWDGRPEFSPSSPFGGAVALMTALYAKRQVLHIGDADFRTDYFAERLDNIGMPVAWLSHSSSRQQLHLLDHPYLFSPSMLVSYFRAINLSRMNRAHEEASGFMKRIRHLTQQGDAASDETARLFLANVLQSASVQYLVLEIGRADPLKDAFNQLWRREERELFRPLKVHLGEDQGEEGFDSGGVQQEFLRLVMGRALDPAYGMFTVDDRTRMTWFQPGGIVPDWKFEMIGLLFSLAVYNGLTLPVTFPRALYRKLLGEPVTDIHHIADGWPDLANAFTELLEWDETKGTVEDVFCRTYEFSIEMFGVHISRQMGRADPSADADSRAATPPPLKSSISQRQRQRQWRRRPSSSSAPLHSPQWPQWEFHAETASSPSADNPTEAPVVTAANRHAYVADYIRHLTHVSIAPQYASFERGFRALLQTKSLSLLTPTLLQTIVEGVQVIDVDELRRHTRYIGWDAAHPTVCDFWAVVDGYDDAMRRRLLEFVTASDRVPVGGMKNMVFVIQKNGEEDAGGHLPTAYTCYGILLLPQYKDREVLSERLGLALLNAQGFGFA